MGVVAVEARDQNGEIGPGAVAHRVEQGVVGLCQHAVAQARAFALEVVLQRNIGGVDERTRWPLVTEMPPHDDEFEIGEGPAAVHFSTTGFTTTGASPSASSRCSTESR